MDQLADYIQKQSILTEPGLVIVGHVGNLEHCVNSLHAHGYHQTRDMAHFAELMGQEHRAFWHFEGGDFAVLGNLLSQYHTGRIGLFDPHTGHTYNIPALTPGFILVMAKHEVERLEAVGYNVLARLGLTLQL